MEFIQEAIASRNVLVWIILVLLCIIFIKVLKSFGKVFFLLILGLGVIFLLNKVSPGLFDPLIEFVGGGWLSDQSPGDK